MKLDYYEKLDNCHVLNQITINDWFNRIKHSSLSNQITEARNGNINIDTFKTEVPCVTYNFHFDKYKLNKNIVSATGYLFIDVDKDYFDINSIDKSKLLAYYRSFRLQGYNIIVRVDGLTLANFKATYEHICKDLGLSEKVYDKCAKKATQFSVLSFDSNIYINDNPFVYSSINNFDTAPTSIVNTGKKKEYTIDMGAPVYNKTRFNDLDRIKIDGNYKVDWDGIEVINCWIPIKKLYDGKYNFLLAYCNNYIYLNQSVEYDKAYIMLCKVAEVAFAKPMLDQQNKIHRILKSVFNYKNDGTLQPIKNKKKRKIIFQDGIKMTKEDKLDIVRNELAIHRTNQSHQRIIDVINNWDFENLGDISSRKIIDNSTLSKNTVNKYYKLFYNEIKAINEEHKVNGVVTISIAA